MRYNVTLLTQEALLFPGTVADNIRYGRSGASDDEVAAAARAADAHAFITALPGGYDTPVGQRGRLLSGGQRQRICLAHAAADTVLRLVSRQPRELARDRPCVPWPLAEVPARSVLT